MSLSIGETAPNFAASTTLGQIDFYEWAGEDWVILFSHPKDYTPVCTTELGELAKLAANFELRNAKIIALSVDDISLHEKWIKQINDSQNCELTFPIIGDTSGVIANLYGMIHQLENPHQTVRTVFFINPEKKIRATFCYPSEVGRYTLEMLRVLDALQLSHNYSVNTPVNWRDGDDVLIPHDMDENEILKKFPKGYQEVYPYLRITPQPE